MVVAVEYISKEESAGVEAAKHGVTGILAVQGAFAEHAAMLDRLGAPWKLLRAAEAETGVRLSTMRRGLDEDTAAFIAAAAAGRHVRRILDAEAVHG